MEYNSDCSGKKGCSWPRRFVDLTDRDRPRPFEAVVNTALKSLHFYAKCNKI